jgi:hypothetical protein
MVNKIIIILSFLIFSIALKGNCDSSVVELANYIPIKLGEKRNEAIAKLQLYGDNFKIDTSKRVFSINYTKVNSNLPMVSWEFASELSFKYDSLDIIQECVLKYYKTDSIVDKRAKFKFLKYYCDPILKILESRSGAYVLSGDMFKDFYNVEAAYFDRPTPDCRQVYDYIMYNSGAIDTCKYLYLTVTINRVFYPEE